MAGLQPPPPASGPAPGQRQIPILCRNCRGPATPAYDGSIHCSFCGTADRLPADELARALELKRRLAAAAAEVAQMRGLESALGHVFESRGAFLRAAGLWLAIAPITVGYTLLQNWNAFQSVPAGLRAGLVASALTGPMFVAGIGVAVMVALLVGRRSYRRRVRHLLFAHAPRQPGLPARCRACDADLPDRRDAFVRCEYCSTENLVTPELSRDRERLLAREAEFYRSRAHRAVAATTRSSLSMSRVFAASVVLVYAGAIAMGYLANALLAT